MKAETPEISMKGRMIGLLVTLVTLYSAVVLGMFFLQRQLMYLPDKHISSPSTYQLAEVSDIRITSKDGTLIQLWTAKAKAGFPTVIYFHGNAGNLAHRSSEFRYWLDQGLGLVALSYRGYGKSNGSPTEEGLYHDARATIEYARNELHIPSKSLVLYGESLGSGVAVQMATEYPLGAMALEAPYTSTANRAAEIYPYLPVHFIMHDQFRSYEKIGRVTMPVILFHGEQDTVIPVAHGKAVLSLITAPKEGHFYPHIGHVDFDIPEQTAKLLAFFKAHGLMQGHLGTTGNHR